MTSIYRYQLEVTDSQPVRLPSSHTFLSIAPARDRYGIDVWARVSPSHHDVTRTLHIFGTGNPIPDRLNLDFLDTAVMSDGLVWHVFLERDH